MKKCKMINMYSAILLAVITYIFNTYIVKLGMQAGFSYIEGGVSLIFLILAIFLPILTIPMYNKENLEADKEYIKRNGTLKYYISKIMPLFVYEIITFVVSLIGIMLFQKRLLFPIQISYMVYIGIIVVSMIYASTIVLIYEIVVGKERKNIALSTILSILALIIPIFLDSNIITMMGNLDFKNVYMNTFNSKILPISSLLVELVYLAILIYLGIAQIKNNRLKEKDDEIIYDYEIEEENEFHIVGNNVVKNEKKVKYIDRKEKLSKKTKIVQMIIPISLIIATSLVFAIMKNYDKYYIGSIDTSIDKTYTLSENLKKELSNLDKKIDIIYNGDNLTELFELKAKEMNRITDKIHYTKLKNADSEKLESEQLYIKEKNDKNNEEEQRLYTFSVIKDGLIPKEENEDYLLNIIDDKIAEGIKVMKLKNEDATIGYLKINGDKESKDNYTVLKESLKLKGRIVKNVSADNIENLKGIKGIIIAEQARDLNEKELEVLKEYMKNGGNFAIFKAPTEKKEKQENFEKLTKEYGINIPLDKVVFDLGEKKRLQMLVSVKDEELVQTSNKNDKPKTNSKIVYDNAVIIPKPIENAFNDIIGLRYPISVMPLLFNGQIEILDQNELDNLKVKIDKLYETSEDAKLIADYTQEDMQKEIVEKGEKGKYTLSTLSTKDIDGKKSKMLAFSSKFMISDMAYPNLTNNKKPVAYVQGVQELIRSIANTLTLEENIELKPKKQYLDIFQIDERADSKEAASEKIAKTITIYSIIVLAISSAVSFINNKLKTEI